MLFQLIIGELQLHYLHENAPSFGLRNLKQLMSQVGYDDDVNDSILGDQKCQSAQLSPVESH